MGPSARNSLNNDRVISLGSGMASIPERLLLAYARGEVIDRTLQKFRNLEFEGMLEFKVDDGNHSKLNTFAAT